jgi:cytochrome b561
MQIRTNQVRYGIVLQVLHWLTVILVLAAYTLSPGGSEQQVYSAARDFGRRTHETLGMAVALVTVLRLAWRALDGTPDDPPMPEIMRLSAKVVHVTLYVLLLSLPVTAILGAWLEGHPLTLHLIGDIASPLPQAPAVGHVIATIHTYLGDVIIWLAGLHAAAALFHHFFLHDRVLRMMLPGADRSS